MINARVVRCWMADGSDSWVLRWPATLSALVLILAVPGASFGQTIWNTTTGDWNTPDNWTLGVPDAGSGTAFDAVIENGGTAQLFDAGASVRRLRVGRAAGGGNLEVNGGELTVTEDFILNFEGADRSSTRVQLGGIVTAPTTVVGYSSTAPFPGSSDFYITGPGSRFNAATSFVVGRGRTGRLYLADGGTLAIGNGTLPLQIAALAGSGGEVNIGLGGAPGVLQASAVQFGAGNGTLSFSHTDNLTFATPIMGAGSVYEFGPGTTTLSATNSYTARTTLYGGTLAISADANLGKPPDLHVSDQLLFGGGTLRATESFTLAANRGISILRTGDGDIYGGTIEVDATKTLTYPRNLNLYLGELTKTGAGTFSLPTLTIDPTGVFHFLGGTLCFESYSRTGTGTFNFHSGTIQLTGNRSVGSDAAIQDLFGAAPTIPFGRGLTVEGTATLLAPVVLDGGTFTVGQLVNASNLRFDRGTLNLTNQDLVIGSAGLFGDALTLADCNIAVTANTTIEPGASLLLQGGSFSSYILTNHGSVTLDGVHSTLAGAVVFNSGVLRGDGRITAPVNNLVTGEIRGELGKTLRFSGTSGQNDGRVTLQGGTLQFSQNLTNAPTGIISGRGTLFFDGGLTNQGKMQFSGGPTDIYGNVSFTDGVGGGELINSGGANVVTFYGNLNHNGDEIRTSSTNTTVFFGNVTGAAPFTGTGAVRFEGSFMPGNSPAAVQFGGDVAFSSEATFAAEIAGTTPGSQHDQILIAGSASFAGTLDVDLIDLGGGIYVPSVGDQFILATYASHTGTFNSLSLPPLAPGLDWTLDYESTLLTLSVSSTMLPGDIDLDGDVDRRDAALFAQHFGTAAGAVWTTGDFDGDGMTTLHDLALQQANFGAVRPGAVSATAAVPEPSTKLLAAMAMIFVLGPNRRNGHGAWRHSRYPNKTPNKKLRK